MEKVYGATERHDNLIVFGSQRAVLVYGFGEENGNTFDYRHEFSHVPSRKELQEVITAHINEKTDQTILSGFVWEDKHVWLSSENQFNFKAAFDVAVQSGGATLPVKFKLGEDEEGNPVYHVFETMEEFSDFHTRALAFIIETLNRGWVEKDLANDWIVTITQ